MGKWAVRSHRFVKPTASTKYTFAKDPMASTGADSSFNFRMQGDIDLESVRAYDDYLKQCIELRPTEVTIDMAEVTFLDSSGLGLLVQFHNALKVWNGKLSIVGLQGLPLQALQIVGLDRFFQLTEANSQISA